MAEPATSEMISFGECGISDESLTTSHCPKLGVSSDNRTIPYGQTVAGRLAPNLGQQGVVRVGGFPGFLRTDNLSLTTALHPLRWDAVIGGLIFDN